MNFSSSTSRKCEICGADLKNVSKVVLKNHGIDDETKLLEAASLKMYPIPPNSKARLKLTSFGIFDEYKHMVPLDRDLICGNQGRGKIFFFGIVKSLELEDTSAEEFRVNLLKAAAALKCEPVKKMETSGVSVVRQVFSDELMSQLFQNHVKTVQKVDFINSTSLSIFQAFHIACIFICTDSSTRSLLLYRRVFLRLRGVKEFFRVIPPSPKNVIILGQRVSRPVLQDSETALLFTSEPADGLPEHFLCYVEIRHLTELLPGTSFGFASRLACLGILHARRKLFVSKPFLEMFEETLFISV
ncbi:unnamed protein product [Soboliphyme baturini]|uniref:Folliculin n=1 Tax=Soboliphyme baturini TaxID=241478 RepID=A0A183IFZ0_9BILA|nr:unnamed protein product [Soboliphyme baturini]